MSGQKKSPLIIIFLTVFLYLVGFGVIIPMIPVLGRDFGASAFQIGLLMSSYSMMQFVFAPMWGHLSDRWGRRPILLFCLLGEGLSYLLFAASKSYEWLLFSRIAAGFFGASLSTANAYISDVTSENERSKGMALIGAAFGLGFILGPALGGLLTWWSGSIAVTAVSVSGLCFITFLFAYFKLEESLVVKKDKLAARPGRLKLLLDFAKKPIVGPLLFAFFLLSVSMSAMEATLILLVGERFQWGIKEVSFGFALVGLFSAFNQGFLVRKLLPIFGERKILLFGLFAMSVALSLVAESQTVVLMAIAMIILSLGFAFSNPAAIGSVSLLTHKSQQGLALGVTQSLASLGRVTGPALGGYLFQHLSSKSPFYSGAILCLVAAGVVISRFQSLPESARQGVAEG